MRYLDRIVLVQEEKRKYDPEKGEQVIVSKAKEIEALANVTDLGTERSKEIFGDIKEGAKVIRLAPLFDVPKWDSVLFDNRKWKLVTERKPQTRRTLIVQESFNE